MSPRRAGKPGSPAGSQDRQRASTPRSPPRSAARASAHPTRRARGSPSSPPVRRPPRTVRRATGRQGRADDPCAPRRSPCCAAPGRSRHDATHTPLGWSASRSPPPGRSLRAHPHPAPHAARCGRERNAPHATVAARRSQGGDRRAMRAPRPPVRAYTPSTVRPPRRAPKAHPRRVPGAARPALPSRRARYPPDHRRLTCHASGRGPRCYRMVSWARARLLCSRRLESARTGRARTWGSLSSEDRMGWPSGRRASPCRAASWGLPRRVARGDLGDRAAHRLLCCDVDRLAVVGDL